MLIIIARGGKWKQYDSNSRDVMTLCRNISLYKLSKVLNFTTMSILSELGDQIYVLLHIDEDNLLREAERIDFPLQFQVGSTDLVSLEPVNERLVPLRYCNLNKPDYIKHIETDLRSFFMLVYKNDPDSIFNQQVGEIIEIPESTWEAYKDFLTRLNMVKYEVIKAIRLNPFINGHITKKVYLKCIEETYKNTGVKLKTLWDYFQEKEFGGFFPYFSPDYDNPIEVRNNYSIILLKYRLLDKACLY